MPTNSQECYQQLQLFPVCPEAMQPNRIEHLTQGLWHQSGNHNGHFQDVGAIDNALREGELIC